VYRISPPRRAAGFCVGRRAGNVIALSLVLLVGCAPSSPYQQPIDAESPIRFATWRADTDSSLTREEWGWFDVAIQEFKFQVMLGRQTTGSEAIDAAVCEKINGRKLGDVMRDGLQAYLKRKTTDKDQLEQAIRTNSKLRIPPGDEAKARELADFQENLQQRLAKLKEEVAAAETATAKLEMKAR
jgi:hexokinase